MSLHFKYFEIKEGCDVGFNDNIPHPDYPFTSKTVGYPKNLTLNKMLKLAKDVNANILIKAGKNAKWYIKRYAKEEITERIQKQNTWREGRVKRCTMYYFEWENTEEFKSC